MRGLAILLALILLSTAKNSTAQTTQILEPVSHATRLPTGESVSTWAAVSYNKLRRGTALNVRYEMFIQPEACFFVADRPAEGQHGLQIVISAGPGLEAAVVQQTKREKRTVIGGLKIANCTDTAKFKVRVAAPMDQPMGLQQVKAEIKWQARNAGGAVQQQKTLLQFPIEVVEHGDRTAKYNESFGYRPKPDLVWRIPTLPFVLVYCAVVGGDCPD